MKNDYTHICIVLDASGSMDHLTRDTKGSINSFLRQQKTKEGETRFDLYQFSDEVAHLVDNADLKRFSKDLMASYSCGGCTALNDAICTAIDQIGARFAAMDEKNRPANVMVAILTDGLENASRKFDSGDVKKRIQEQRDVYSWDFIYLAADPTAFEAGENLGIKREDRVLFEASSAGMNYCCCYMSERADVVRNRNSQKKGK